MANTPQPTNDKWLKSQCNRYVNGVCQTLGCLRRGGYHDGPLHYDCATCEPHELLTELQHLRSEVQGLNYELAARR